MFHLDPLVVLGGRLDAERCEVEDADLAWCVRVAAHELIAEAIDELNNSMPGR